MSSYHLLSIRPAVDVKEIAEMARQDPTMFTKKCSYATHQRIRTHADLWLKRIIPRGKERVMDEEGRRVAGYTETGVCRDCGSTLSFHDVVERRSIKTPREEAEAIDEAIKH